MKNDRLEEWYNNSFEHLEQEPPPDVWEGIKLELASSGNVAGQPDNVVTMARPNPFSAQWIKIAAAVLILLGGTFTVLNYVGADAPAADLSYNDHLKNYPHASLLEYKTPDNVDVFNLPDGSTVYLNKDSKLTYPNKFEGDERVVILEGECFFDVKKNPDKPFIIFSGNTKTEVLGTTFNLRAYPEQENVEVMVLTGRVKFSRITDETENKKMVNLTKQKKGIYMKEEDVVKDEALEESWTTWKDDKEIIKETNLYKKESARPTNYLTNNAEWTMNRNTTVIKGEIGNSSSLLEAHAVVLKATYFKEDGTRIASKFFTIEKTIAPGGKLTYEHIMNDWIDETDNIEVSIQSIRLKK